MHFHWRLRWFATADLRWIGGEPYRVELRGNTPSASNPGAFCPPVADKCWTSVDKSVRMRRTYGRALPTIGKLADSNRPSRAGWTENPVVSIVNITFYAVPGANECSSSRFDGSRVWQKVREANSVHRSNRRARPGERTLPRQTKGSPSLPQRRPFSAPRPLQGACEIFTYG